jgi:hypothetical protein
VTERLGEKPQEKHRRMTENKEQSFLTEVNSKSTTPAQNLTEIEEPSSEIDFAAIHHATMSLAMFHCFFCNLNCTKDLLLDSH